MRLHAAILGVAIAGFASWLAFWPRADHPDLVRARDSLVASDAIVVRFDPGGVAGYRFISVKDEGWLWERTDASGNPYPDALLFTGEDHLLRIADACYIAVRDLRPPLIPGVTFTPRLARQAGLDHQAEGRYAYAVAPGFAARPDYPSSLPDVEITEDLSRLRDDGTIHASTGSDPGYIWRGDYSIARASAADVERVRAVLREAHASEYAEIVLRERVFGNIIGNIISEPSSVIVAEECAGHPARLWPGSGGGQAEGLRATPAPFDLTHGPAPVFRNSATTTASIRGPVDYLLRAFEGATFGDVPITSTDTVLVNRGRANGVAISIISCTSRPWFQC
ncbi:MAG: hypothetical protein ACRDHF_09710 [Tepidiformaceae bacterium]